MHIMKTLHSHEFAPSSLHSCHRDLTDCVSPRIRWHECCHRRATPVTQKFRETFRRFRRKIIHPIANTYVCIATHILKRWHIHAGVLAHTCGSVFLVMSFECLFIPYKRWITQVVSSGCVSSLIGLCEYSHMVS